MKQNNTSLSLHETELQVARARLAFNTDLHRVGAACQAALTRPSTLLMAAGATGVLGFWFARRTTQAPVRNQPPQKAKQTASSVLGLVLGFMVRYGAQRLLAAYANRSVVKSGGA